MKCYRTQPQSASHIYRSVLITPRNPSQGNLSIPFALLFLTYEYRYNNS